MLWNEQRTSEVRGMATMCTLEVVRNTLQWNKPLSTVLNKKYSAQSKLDKFLLLHVLFCLQTRSHRDMVTDNKIAHSTEFEHSKKSSILLCKQMWMKNCTFLFQFHIRVWAYEIIEIASFWWKISEPNWNKKDQVEHLMFFYFYVL